MAGNSFGELFKITTYGESHGPAIGCVIDGVPPHLVISKEIIQKDLDRRKPGQSEITTQRKESDIVEILSGVFEGKTTGAPIGLLIRNSDHRSNDYNNIKDIFRPGHADYVFTQKFGVRDHRGGGRSSGRETAARVAAGAVAKAMIAQEGISVIAYTLAIGGVRIQNKDLSLIDKNVVRAPDAQAAERMVAAIQEAQAEGDSLGGIIELMISGCPEGLGDPVFDKLDACLAHGILSIGAFKGIEFGSGFLAAEMKGSQNNDEVLIQDGKMRARSNYAGGISGGISNGDPIIFRAVVKPTASISKKQIAASKDMILTDVEVIGRHDPCIVPRALPVAEAMAAIVLADRLLIQRSLRK